MEALLGEQQAGTGGLANRLASIVGKTEKERDEIRKFFKKEIYELRSVLVHGKEEVLDKRTMNDHFLKARYFARQSLVWFLHYLDYVLQTTRNDTDLPNREELLSMLDFRSESRDKVKHLLRILPPDFPRTSGWLDQ